MTDDTWPGIASFGSLVEAEIAAGRLESADVPFFIDQRDNVGIFGPGHAGATVRGIVLRVPPDFVEDAKLQLDLESGGTESGQ
ncbi:MAG: hypothetical protein PVF05_02575 [Gemmatimonadales bacterium]|jgi:hypothetical protein